MKIPYFLFLFFSCREIFLKEMFDEKFRYSLFLHRYSAKSYLTDKKLLFSCFIFDSGKTGFIFVQPLAELLRRLIVQFVSYRVKR